MSSNTPPIWVILKAHFRADPRKTGLLGVLTLVLLAVCIRVYIKSGPASAEAADPSLLPGHRIPTPPEQNRVNDRSDVLTRHLLLATPPDKLKRNPFVVAAKIPQHPSDQLPNTDEEAVAVIQAPAEEIQACVEQLQLEMTLCGDHSRACINGRMLSQGQLIAGFLVKRIEPTQVVLTRNGVDVTLRLKEPSLLSE